ncbi:LysE family transporter [Draconibacterium sediminis]|uniref:LysE family transporter n=1 Tax=Draconibacterium sediminis TaxID=1544798 RepID=UPI0026EF72D6|nr:LysE family transporter [Draconibacterium sediminis]
MDYSVLLFLFISMIATVVGAVPLGLVNLSVINLAVKNNLQSASLIAHGASLVETLFAMAALSIGAKLSPLIEDNPVVQYFVFTVLLISGLFFWFNKNQVKTSQGSNGSSSFVKGILLNLVSIQVLLFWLLVSAMLSSKRIFPESVVEMLFFAVGVWLAKMGVLKGYAHIARKLAVRIKKISANVNRIIGAIMFLLAIVQLIRL